MHLCTCTRCTMPTRPESTPSADAKRRGVSSASAGLQGFNFEHCCGIRRWLARHDKMTSLFVLRSVFRSSADILSTSPISLASTKPSSFECLGEINYSEVSSQLNVPNICRLGAWGTLMSSQKDTTEPGSEDFLKAPKDLTSSVASDMAAQRSRGRSVY